MSWLYWNKLKIFFIKYERKFIQFGVLFIYNIKFHNFKTGNIDNGCLKNVCTPGMNCYSCPGAVASCPIGILQNLLINSKYKLSFLDKIPFFFIGLLLFFGILFGRFICGFLCPFGLLQEIFYKIKIPKLQKNNVTKRLIYIKYFVLFFIVLVFTSSYNEPIFCKYFCPVGTLESGIYHVFFNKLIKPLIGFLFVWKLAILLLVLISSIFIFRIFCRFFCPLGAFYGFFNKISFVNVKVDKTKCCHCNKCINFCKMDVNNINDSECIKCGECIKKCDKKAIYFDIQ